MADARDDDADRHARIEQLLHAAAEMPTHSRTEWLQAQCGGDEVLRSRVEAMLAADAQGHELLDGGLSPDKSGLANASAGRGAAW